MTEPKINENFLPRFSINRPVTVLMILLSIVVVGALAYYKIKMDLMPSGLNPPFMGVYVPYSNGNPKEIEEQIVKPVEGELKTVKNVKRLYANSFRDGCWFWMEFAQGSNMDTAYAQVADRIERARAVLPNEVERIFVRRFRDDSMPVVVLGIAYDETIKDPYFITDKYFKQTLESIKGVAQVEVFGLQEKNVQIIVDMDKVRAYRLNLVQLMTTLMTDNFAISNGYVFVGKKKYLLRTKSRFNNLDEVRQLQLGNGVRLENVAEVVYDTDEEVEDIMRVDGRPAAGLVIQKESEANTVEVCQLILERLESAKKGRPELKGVDNFVIWNQGYSIVESIDNVKTTMMWGGIFAFIVLLLFLRKTKITLIITLAIPLSLLISLLATYALGWTLNAMTMMGMMIAIGMVVDNSIVITENIYRLSGLGYDLRKAAVLGASEVGLAILLATLTTIVVFIPMMVMTGNSFMSFYLTRIGVPVIFAILGSLLIALILIPLASLYTVPPKAEIIHFTHNRITQWYQNALVKVMKHRTDAMIVLLIIILSTFIPFSLMKSSDSSEGGPTDARVICQFPANYNVEKSDRVLDHITKKLLAKKDQLDIDHVLAQAEKFRGSLEIYLKPQKDAQWYEVIYRKFANLAGISYYKRLSREELTEEIKKLLPEMPGVKFRTSWRQQAGGDDSAIVYTLNGYDIGVLEELASQLERQFKLVEGVLTVDTGAETGNDEIHVEVDRDKSYNLGTNPNYLGQLIRFSLGKRKISNFQTPEREIEIFVKARKDQRESVMQLKNTFIKADSGKETTLAALSDMTYHKSVGSIRRENGKTSLEIKIYCGSEDLKRLSGKLEGILKGFNFPSGYSYTLGGRSSRFVDQNADIVTALLLSIILVFLIMGVLFESFTLPFSVLIAIPAAFVGSFWLLYLTGTTFEIMAGIGLVILIGIVVNNAIVLIDLINQYRKGGMLREHAIVVAGMHRFRPILMTALTTIVGLLPMAVGNTGLLGIPYSPMGVTLIGGMFSSTLLTLFAVPVFYTYFDDFRGFIGSLVKRF